MYKYKISYIKVSFRVEYRIKETTIYEENRPPAMEHKNSVTRNG